MHTFSSHSFLPSKLLTSLFINALILLALVFSNELRASENQQATLSVNNPNGIQLEVFSDLDPLQINIMHSWRIRLTESDSALSGANITMTGGMPDHDHGLPTRAVVTQELEPGLYLLEGIRFHMPGRWQLIFTIEKDGRDQQATIDFTL